jgi:chromosome segregation ATPase
MNKWTVLVGAGLLAGALLSPAHAADTDSKVSREREMLRRAQEALRQSEAEKSDLTRAKLDSEQKLNALSKELNTARNGSKAGQAALRAKLESAATAQADVQKKLDDADRQVAALTVQQHEKDGQLAARDSQIKQLQQDLQISKTTGASCETKNRQLYVYSQDLLERYKKKGVWSALAQKEPVFGLKEVGIENTVQEYHDKLASEKLNTPPSAAPLAAPPSNAAPPAAQNPAH